MKLVSIPSGEFRMGTPAGGIGAVENEQPQHNVRITKPFFMGAYEVTQAQYERVMQTNPSSFRGKQHPVDSITWHDAVEFCKRLSELPDEAAAGRSYRLPTEAEWEYACRAGSDREFSYGFSELKPDQFAWFDKNSSNTTHPVGQKHPNRWGLYDIHGNALEWCHDWYGPYVIGNDNRDPGGPDEGERRVLRGGSFWFWASHSRSAYRYACLPEVTRSEYGYGVRVVMTIQQAIPDEQNEPRTNSR